MPQNTDHENVKNELPAELLASIKYSQQHPEYRLPRPPRTVLEDYENNTEAQKAVKHALAHPEESAIHSRKK